MPKHVQLTYVKLNTALTIINDCLLSLSAELWHSSCHKE